MLRKILLMILSTASLSFAGSYNYKFLKMEMTPYQAVFGPSFAAAPLPGSFFSNPSLLPQESEFVVSMNSYIAGITYGQIAYARKDMGFYANFLNSGSIPKLDEAGNYLGDFQVNFITLGGAYRFKKLSNGLTIGVGGNLTYRRIESDYSVGVTANGGAFYPIDDVFYGRLNLGIALRNIGLEVKKFSNTRSSAMPIQLQMGAVWSSREGLGFAFGADYSLDYGLNLSFTSEIRIQKFVSFQFGYQLHGKSYHFERGRDILSGVNFGVKVGAIRGITVVYSFSPLGAVGDVHRLEVISRK